MHEIGCVFVTDGDNFTLNLFEFIVNHSVLKPKKMRYIILSAMITLLGSEYNEDTQIFTFYYHNTETNWYYEMSCRNVFGTSDMHHRTKTLSREDFIKIAGDRLA